MKGKKKLVCFKQNIKNNSNIINKKNINSNNEKKKALGKYSIAYNGR